MLTYQQRMSSFKTIRFLLQILFFLMCKSVRYFFLMCILLLLFYRIAQYLESQWWPKFILWTNLMIEGKGLTCESNQTIEGSIMVAKKQDMDGKTLMRVDEFVARRQSSFVLHSGKALFDFTRNVKNTEPEKIPAAPGSDDTDVTMSQQWSKFPIRDRNASILNAALKKSVGKDKQYASQKQLLPVLNQVIQEIHEGHDCPTVSAVMISKFKKGKGTWEKSIGKGILRWSNDVLHTTNDMDAEFLQLNFV